MVRDVIDTLRHPAGVTGIATVVGYGLILVLMTAVLFGGAWAVFSLLG